MPVARDRTGRPSAPERTQIIARLRNMGYTAADVAVLVQSQMTRRELAEAIVSAQRTAKRAKS